MTEETVTTQEAMKILGVSKATVSRLVKRGELAAYKLTPAENSPLRIYKDSLDELLEKRQQ
jgi:excisionase family DNA binding protein